MVKTANKTPGRHKKKRILIIIFGSLLILLIAVRIALPYILLKFVNNELNQIPGYQGKVDDIDVALIRGAYIIKGIQLNKTGGNIPVPFFSADKTNISIEWHALLHGAIVAQIIVTNPVLNFVKGPTEATSQTTVDKSWVDVVNKLIPFKLNRFEVNKGEIHYRDYHSSPTVDIFMQKTHIVAENLTNTEHNKDSLPATVLATADIYGGQLNVNVHINPFTISPTFEMKATLTSTNITDFNNFFKAYGKFDVKKGSLSVYTEAAAKDNKIIGYTKPIIKDLQVLDLEQDAKNPGHLIWQSLIALTAWVFKNHPNDQLATKIDFAGEIKGPNISIWALIGQTLRNAFIQALYPSLENSITIKQVDEVKGKKPLLKRIFGKKSTQ